MKLYFIRHAENQANIDHILSYKIVDLSLTPLGIQQATAVAEWLSDKHIATIYSSPMQRTMQTAEIIAQRLRLPEIVALEELREINVGLLDGRRDGAAWEAHDAIIRRWARGETDVTFEGGESLLALRERTKRAIERVVAENAHLSDDAGVVLVSHSGILNYGLSWLCNHPAGAQFRPALAPTAIIMVDAKHDQIYCVEWGLDSHLLQPGK
jgi:2,3-bisphosphoglycerate-dependent phosphoglycerate mutase